MYFDKSWYVCVCGDTTTDSRTKLPSTLRPCNLHQLGDLFFCPSCQVLKCKNCCTVSVELKYCVNCMTDYSDNAGLVRCTKNCFECPHCTSPLTVAVKDSSAETVRGKQFTFGCVSCDYKYTTLVITKPAALSTIVKNETKSRFPQLYEHYLLRHTLAELDQKSNAPRKLPHSVVSRMKAMDIKKPADHMEEVDRISAQLAVPCTVEIDPEEDFHVSGAQSYPLGKFLTAKRSYHCDTCRTPLVVPVADHRLMKIPTKELAVDIVPTIAAKVKQQDVRNFTPGSDTACTLNLINATSSSISLTVSILSQLPPSFMNNDGQLAISFPFTHFSIQARRDKTSTIDSIPSPYLTGNTKTARAEQLMRASRREAQKRQNDGNEFIEVGPNWVSVPFSVTVSGEKTVAQPKIPFYITIESKLPESWKPVSSRKGLKYGFWVVCLIE